MIEAPEAQILARQINENLSGRKISLIEVLRTPHRFTFWYNENPAIEDKLCERIIGEARAAGGMVVIDLEDSLLAFTDGCNISLIAPGGDLPKKRQLLIGTYDDYCLAVSVRMYGCILVLPPDVGPGGLGDYYISARDKPQVMGERFNLDYFRRLFIEADPKLTLKAFLATEQRIPGLGNGVLQDILFNAGMHPRKKLSSLRWVEVAELHKAVTQTLVDMLHAGGRSSETDLLGRPGGYIPILGKDTLGKECPRCGDFIMKEHYLGGVIYYCPGCQII